MIKYLIKSNKGSVCIPFKDIIEANRATGIEDLTLQEMFDVANKKDINHIKDISTVKIKKPIKLSIPSISISVLVAIICLLVLFKYPGKTIYAYQEASNFDLLLSPSMTAYQPTVLTSLTPFVTAVLDFLVKIYTIAGGPIGGF